MHPQRWFIFRLRRLMDTVSGPFRQDNVSSGFMLRLALQILCSQILLQHRIGEPCFPPKVTVPYHRVPHPIACERPADTLRRAE